MLEGFQRISDALRAGVYALGFKGEIVYVGKSKSMFSRVHTHRSLWARKRKGESIPGWVPIRGILFDEIYIRPCALEEIDAIESEMIRRYKPRYNTQLKGPEPVIYPHTIMVQGRALTIGIRAKPKGIERRI